MNLTQRLLQRPLASSANGSGMGILKNIGYTLVAILVFFVIVFGGAIIAAIIAALGAFVLVAGVVGLIAFCIRDYCEFVSDRKNES